MSTRDVRIAMSDGETLAATLYLPDTGLPVPCLLEALPYRKDDITLSYAPEYERLRDEFGYAVCRVDVRGTGSSTGIALDEYQPREQDDLVAVIEWLAAREWCDGNVGMYGTSYSGFNSIQVAMRRPPALKAIVPIYATDDRYTDDVHYMGGARRLLDVVDYPTYMIAMNALPPVPAIFGDGWRDEWARRIASTPPWLLAWTASSLDSDYWRHGSLRPAYDAITAPTMIVAGWADGYRNNTLRTYAALSDAGTPVRLLVGPWSHQSPDSARPGPHVDLCREMARWFDRWLRSDDNGIDREPGIVYFARRSTPPAPDTALIRGQWQAEAGWPSARVVEREFPLGGGVVNHRPIAGTGTAAWNSCAGALPWGQPTDQRYDDAASLVFEWPGDGIELLGYARLRLKVAADRPVATVSAKLCDVAPDGTSTLITRGLLNLTHRGSVAELPVGAFVDVCVELEATSWAFAPGHRIRLAVTGMDWPNTVAAPTPFTLAIDGDASGLTLPVAGGPPLAAPATPHTVDAPASGDDAGITWRITDDVLTRTTSATVDHGSTYDIRGGTATDRYAGTVDIDRRTWRQLATSSAAFTLTWDEGLTVRTESEVSYAADETATTLDITLRAYEDDREIAVKTWHAVHPRELG